MELPLFDLKANACCSQTKCGEFNPLRCAAPEGHEGEHCYVVDGEYPKVDLHKIAGDKYRHDFGECENLPQCWYCQDERTGEFMSRSLMRHLEEER